VQVSSVAVFIPSTTVKDMHSALHPQTPVVKFLRAVHHEWQLTPLAQVLVQPQASLRRVDVVVTVVVVVVVVVVVLTVLVTVKVVVVHVSTGHWLSSQQSDGSQNPPAHMVSTASAFLTRPLGQVKSLHVVTGHEHESSKVVGVVVGVSDTSCGGLVARIKLKIQHAVRPPTTPTKNASIAHRVGRLKHDLCVGFLLCCGSSGLLSLGPRRTLLWWHHSASSSRS